MATDTPPVAVRLAGGDVLKIATAGNYRERVVTGYTLNRSTSAASVINNTGRVSTIPTRK